MITFDKERWARVVKSWRFAAPYLIGFVVGSTSEHVSGLALIVLLGLGALAGVLATRNVPHA